MQFVHRGPYAGNLLSRKRVKNALQFFKISFNFQLKFVLTLVV